MQLGLWKAVPISKPTHKKRLATMNVWTVFLLPGSFHLFLTVPLTLLLIGGRTHGMLGFKPSKRHRRHIDFNLIAKLDLLDQI
jgi:hypothetical protein